MVRPDMAWGVLYDVGDVGDVGDSQDVGDAGEVGSLLGTEEGSGGSSITIVGPRAGNAKIYMPRFVEVCNSPERLLRHKPASPDVVRAVMNWVSLLQLSLRFIR